MVRVVGALLAAGSLAVVAAGCGGSGGSAQSTRAAAPSAKPCATHPAAARRANARLAQDVVRLRRAAKTVPSSAALKGNAAVNNATDAFLHEVETAPIGDLARNRWDDHAMAALSGSCELCIGAIEADRPNVSIRFRDSSCQR